MESADNSASPSSTPAADTRRRSGRVTRVPEKFQPEAALANKRKRGTDQEDDDDVENQDPDEGVDVSDEEADDSGDEDNVRPKRKKPASQTTKARKPAVKKPKINGAAHATGLPSRPKAKKTARVITGDNRDGDGIYADIFGSGDSSDDVASRWYQKYQDADENAVTDLVNCVLLAAGCDQKVTEDDIRDPDNIQGRLSELQDVYQDQQITDYPLAKAKESKAFRDLLTGFFRSLITVLHETDVLYKDAPLMENIARWVGTMSSSSLRPFRHTATAVALAMELALVDVAKKLDDRITKSTQQLEAEKNKKGKSRNKNMLASLQRQLDEANHNRELCGDHIRDFFEVVFVHRYRDIDPRIRTECVEALGSWIWVLPTVFMEPEYLRYLGWMLSDIVPSTRQEVLKQLARVFKRDASKLGHFIDRFRPRLMEMAAKDSDIGVRVAAISVIETLRTVGMLEPDEIDATCKLIYDSEPRIRKAVVQFFADSVGDIVESKVEEIGGAETLEDLFLETEDADYSSPRKDWIQIKALAETLAAYDAQLEDEVPDVPRGLDIGAEMVHAAVPETRISLAAQALYEKVEAVKNWEALSGFLLFDHSTSTKSKSKPKGASADATFRKAVAPEGSEESVLLEVLASSVRQSLVHSHDAEKSKKKQAKLEPTESGEDIALHLALTIPKLLKKFGAEPATATVVLRLEHSLDLDVFQQLRQDSTTYSRLLDEICTQFNRHVDKGVLTEATSALLHARKYEELEEVADSKISGLWENSINALRNFDKVAELSMRGNLEESELIELRNILTKIKNLARVADCVDVLEAESKSDDSKSPAVDILVKTVRRGRYHQVDEELDDLEDDTTSLAIQCSMFYFMWKVRSIMSAVGMQTNIANESVDRLSLLRKSFQTYLIETLSSRAINDDLRLFATGSLCDLHVLLSSIQQTITQWQQAGAAKKYENLQILVQQIPPGLVPELISIFDGAERAYAKKTKKTLNEPAEDEDPIDDEPLDDEEEDEETSPEEKRAAELKAEKTLCELTGKLVMAILSRVVDLAGPQPGRLRKRLLRNQLKLGTNFRDTLAYLDEKKLKELVSGKKKSSKSKGKQPVAAKRPAISDEIVVADDDSDEEENPFEDDEPEEGTIEDLRRRELLDDPIENDEEQADGPANDGMDEDDDILGD
ncbi:putative stag domain-containing protein [Phaeoacremonium minimum UCRPA7]|uniref:Putative stag domain-containing protein n=1 Tax=Phaeoacremonium minimum (strain UCR-PA7) TaxID=1286976 RepID=R8BUG3_PHAM7|nr:putative stag domain-containing protein [Phaeoacremonium minimum UCRPA7]EOO02934.1 putative stag domain-containing protein [Phaeoacremonium minimum UCRPA7]